MLVLSRRIGQKIVFPTVNAVVQIVSLKSGAVRLGIEAPDQVPVFREELLGQAPAPPNVAGSDQPSVLRRLVHQINNCLNSSTIGLALLRRQIDLGLTKETAATLTRIEQELAGLRETVEPFAAKPIPPVKPSSRRRALLVEDDANECELLAGFLRLAGVEVETAGDGAVALDHLSTHEPPDVVLLDMLMPRCDGPSTVRAIRGNPAHAGLKIIGVTGSDPSTLGLPEGPGGIDRWFRKPLNPEALLRELGVAPQR